MIIELHLPRKSEAEVTYDQKEGVITITPIFSKPQETKPILYAMVRGAKGNLRKSTIAVTARAGTIVAHNANEVSVVPEFDREPVEPDKKDKKKPAANVEGAA